MPQSNPRGRRGNQDSSSTPEIKTADQEAADNKLSTAPETPEMAFDPIEAALRQLHESVASEEIPDDFVRLLDQLDDRSSPK